ncbi:hypothetical protein GCM10023116_28100 [Kistimonas scapharcae]|uniref:Lysine transporter LysE n=2 Tax=Kistimonas scapharcae TaxID=1036133 RepID=A0ABP8V3X9_9GAMM
MLVIIYWSTIKGRWCGIKAALGVSASSCLQASLTAFGLSALLRTFPFLFTTIKCVGALYLVYTGLSIIKSARLPPTFTQNSDSRPFIQAFFTNALNPKAFLFFQALLPQFIDFNAGDTVTRQFIVLGYTASVLALLYYLVLVEIMVFLGKQRFAKRDTSPLIHWLTGLLLITLGIGLLFYAQQTNVSET